MQEKRLEVTQRLINAAEAIEDCLVAMRYCTWPSNFKPEVTAETIDVALQESESAIRQAKRLVKLEASEKGKIKLQALAKLTDEEKKALNLRS